MPKTEPQSYETQGTGYLQADDRNALIAQIASEIPRNSPSSGILVTFQGDDAIVRFQCIDRNLDDRSRVDLLTKDCEKLVRDFMKEVKSEYRKRSGKTLKATENKDRRDYTIQKVSLNGNFHYVYQQVYSVE